MLAVAGIVAPAHAQLEAVVGAQDNVDHRLHWFTQGQQLELAHNLGQQHLHLQLGKLLANAVAWSGAEGHKGKGRGTFAALVALRLEAQRFREIGRIVVHANDAHDHL